MVLMENVSVSMREGSSLDILTRKSDVESILDQSWEGKSFSCSPVDACSCFDTYSSGVEDFFDKSMEVFVRW